MSILLILGAKDVAAYWSDRTFDGFPVIPIPVSSDGRKGDVFWSASEIEKFILSSLENINQTSTLKHQSCLNSSLTMSKPSSKVGKGFRPVGGFEANV